MQSFDKSLEFDGRTDGNTNKQKRYQYSLQLTTASYCKT